MGTPSQIIGQQFRDSRLHIPTGEECNNRCRFCMEKDLEARRDSVRQFSMEEVRRHLEQHRDIGTVLFAKGEPTLNPNLMEYISLAREFCYKKITIVTNGRRLSDRSFCENILEAGVNELIISVHGPSPEIHDALTTRPGSFSETWQGILNVSDLRPRYPLLEVFFSTVLNRVNLPHIEAMIKKWLSVNITGAVFIPVYIEGFANDNADELVVPLPDVANAFREAIYALPEPVSNSKIRLAGLPFCVMAGIETYWEISEKATLASVEHKDGLLWIADENHTKHQKCLQCAYNQFCTGVDKKYSRRFGWDAFIPVEQIPDHVQKFLEEKAQEFAAALPPDEPERQKIEEQIETLHLELVSGTHFPKEKKAELAWQIGTLYLRLGQLESAIKYLNDAVQFEPYFGDAQIDLANALIQAGYTEKACEILPRTERLQLSAKSRGKLESAMRMAGIRPCIRLQHNLNQNTPKKI